MIGHGPADLGRQGTVATLRLAALQVAGTMAEFCGMARTPQGGGLQVAERGVIGEAELPRQPGHRHRRHAGAAGLFAHRQQRDVVGMALGHELGAVLGVLS